MFAKEITNKIIMQRLKISPYIDIEISSLIGFLLVYVFVRMYAVIQGDMSLVNLQSDFLSKM